MSVEGYLQAGCPILLSASRRDGTSYVGGSLRVCERKLIECLCVLILDLLSISVEGSLQAGCPILLSASRRDGTSYVGGSLRVCERKRIECVCVLILDLLSMSVEEYLQAGCPILLSASRRDGTSYVGGSLRVCERKRIECVCTDTGFVEHERRGIFAGRMPPSFCQLPGEMAHLMSGSLRVRENLSLCVLILDLLSMSVEGSLQVECPHPFVSL